MRILILVFLLSPLFSYGQRIETGKIDNAPFKIIIPKNWNKGLVMYVRGAGGGGPLESFNEDENKKQFNKIITSRGYALAYSAFSKEGDSFFEAYEETEVLRSYFVEKYGQPNLTLITGHSMGGMISIASIENYKDEYDGALPMCSFLPSPNIHSKICLDRLVLFDYFFGANDGKIVNSKEYVSDEEIKRLVSKNKSFNKVFAEYLKIKEKDIPGIIGFSQWVIKRTIENFGGLAVGNRSTMYDGFDTFNSRLNQKVRRYDYDKNVNDLFNNFRNFNGELSDPVLNIMTTYDPILPPGFNEIYKFSLEKEESIDLYAQQYVNGEGHCNISNEQFASAFDDIIGWIKTGNKPKFQEILLMK